VAGQHQLKVGADLNWERQDSTRPNEYPSGSYTLLFNRGVPAEMRPTNTPTIPIDRLYSQAAFATDGLVARRVTLALRRTGGSAMTHFYPGSDRSRQDSSAARRARSNRCGCSDVDGRRSAVSGMNWECGREIGQKHRSRRFGFFGVRWEPIRGEPTIRNGRGHDQVAGGRPCAVTAYERFLQPSNTSCDYLPGKRRFQSDWKGITSARPAASNTLPNPT